VNADLSGAPAPAEVFVIGDSAGRDGLPGLAEKAMQGGLHVTPASDLISAQASARTAATGPRIRRVHQPGRSRAAGRLWRVRVRGARGLNQAGQTQTTHRATTR
jgi:hypothetical protein